MNQEITRRQLLRNTAAVSVAAGGFATTSAAQGRDTGAWLGYGNDELNTGFNEGVDVSGSSASQQWTLNTSDAATSGISSQDGTVYFTDVSGRAYQVTADGQTEIFDSGTQAGAADESLPTSTPAIDSERIYIGGLSQQVFAVDTSGDEQWTYESEAAIRSSPVYDSNHVYVATVDGDVVCIDSVSGSEEWVFDTDGTIYSSPVLLNETVYVCTENGSVFAVETGTGDGDQITSLDGSVVASPVSDGDSVYIVDDQGSISAIGPSAEWDESIDDTITATPSVADETLYVATEGEDVLAVDTESGTTEWRITVDGGVETAIAVAGETVVVGTENGLVYGIDIEAEEIEWEYAVGTAISTPISVAGDTIYVGSTNGQVLALGTDSEILTNLADAAASGDVDEARGVINDNIPQEVQMLAGVGVAGIASYLTLGKLRKRTSSDTVSEDTESFEPTTLSGDATPIGPESTETAAEPEITDASYDDFERLESLGSGGTADVYKARYKNGSEDLVAIKVPRSSDASTIDTSAFDDFLNEAEVWNEIGDHERIVSVHTWGDTPLPWIAIEYMDAGDLTQQEFTSAEIFGELEGLAEGLHHAHRHGVTHADIKPENILYKSTADGTIGKLTDWGFANKLLEHSMSVKGFTPSYSAPEQFEPEKYGGTDERTDIYQLGVVAYELFTGELPYEGTSHGESVMAVLNDEPRVPSEVNSELDGPIDTVLLKALAKEKSDRYETALHFRDDLRRAYDMVVDESKAKS